MIVGIENKIEVRQQERSPQCLGFPGGWKCFSLSEAAASESVNRVNGAVVSRGEAGLEVGLEQRSHILLSNDSQVLTHLRNQQWAD